MSECFSAKAKVGSAAAVLLPIIVTVMVKLKCTLSSFVCHLFLVFISCCQELSVLTIVCSFSCEYYFRGSLHKTVGETASESLMNKNVDFV